MVFDQAKFTSQLQAVGKLYKEALIDFGRATATNNVIDLVKAIELVANEGERATALGTAARRFRTQYSSLMSESNIRSHLDPIFRSYLRDVIGAAPDELQNIQGSWQRIYEHFLFTSPGVPRVPIYSLRSRSINYGLTAASQSGTGNGIVKRLTIDPYNYEIEGAPCPFTVNFECVRDVNTGTEPGEEEFSVSGPGRTDILDEGSGVSNQARQLIASLNSDGDFLGNASFQDEGAANADPSDLSDWIDPTGVYGSAKYAIVADGYRSSVEEIDQNVTLALEIKGEHTIQQELEDLLLFTPYYWSMAIKPLTGLTAGEITVSWGNKTRVFDLSSLVVNSWNLVGVDNAPGLNPDLYPYNFNDSSNLFKIAVTSPLVGGNVLVDAITFQPMRKFAGTWWAIVPGTQQFLAGTSRKTFQFTDALDSVDSILQRLIALAYQGRYLPHALAPSIADPAA